MPKLNTKSIVVLVVFVLAVSLVSWLFYLWGYPRSDERIFKFKRGSLDYVIRQFRSDPLPGSFSSTLYVGSLQEGYDVYYLEHEDFYWWSADVQEKSGTAVTIIKNGNPIVELDLATSETTHFRNGSKRPPMDKIDQLNWQ